MTKSGKFQSMKTRAIISDVIVYTILSIGAIVWLIPIFWIVLTSFRAELGPPTSYFLPKGYSFDNYVKIWTDINVAKFQTWMLNTLIVSVCTCILSALLTISTAYVISKIKFKMRKPYMNIAMILGMFPGFMSMIAVYYILKAVGLTQTLVALVLVYSGGAGLGFYIAKGFFDTIPFSLNEAAKVDGANSSTIFFKIILPLAKPILVYTILMAFMAPWTDFIFARVILGDRADLYTVAVGLYSMAYSTGSNSNPEHYTYFAAGCMLVAIPITILFMFLQKYYVEGVTGGAVKG